MEGKTRLWDVKINSKWCKRCGLCVAFCPRGVLKLDDEGRPVVVDIAHCTGCLLCEMHCPDFAIAVKRSE
ncbi:MAG TPA: 4Fe-4S binding protein [Firmicutes bacterium]|nr:4Fe-4S binding protein [Candidatus Fermentithermobacillaceae bacterium]